MTEVGGAGAAAGDGESAGAGESVGRRQRVVRVPGARRAKLTPAPGTTAEPAPADEDRTAPVVSGERGPNDDRLRADVPPHY